MVIGLVIFIEIILIILCGVFFFESNESYDHEVLFGILGFLCLILLFAVPIGVSKLHGYIDYHESNDKDLARITAVTQEQDIFKTYYKVDVEYLTNTPKQEGIVTNNRIETDTFYCYYENKELVEKLKSNMYKELWIISGYKGGYETYKDFGTKLIKDIELKEENI